MPQIHKMMTCTPTTIENMTISALLKWEYVKYTLSTFVKKKQRAYCFCLPTASSFSTHLPLTYQPMLSRLKNKVGLSSQNNLMQKFYITNGTIKTKDYRFLLYSLQTIESFSNF